MTPLPNNHVAVEVNQYATNITSSAGYSTKNRTYYALINGEREVLFALSNKYKLVCKGSEVTEEICKGIVKTVDYDLQPSPSNDWQGDWDTAWRDYDSQEESPNSEFPYVRTALLSFASLLTSLNLKGERIVILKKEPLK